MPIDFKSIKSLFIVEDPNAPKQAEAAAQPVAQPEAPSAQPIPTSTRPGEVNLKFVEVLSRAMEAANLPGVDYLEYRQSLKSLEKMPMEEQVRYQSAFAMAQAMGATPAKLIESAGHYMNVLKTEQAKFDEALRNQTAERIGNRQEMLKNLDATLKQKAEQIKKLTQEMEQHRAEMEKLDLEIREASGKVEATKQDFLASHQALAAQINADVENMKRFLK
jgi:predicted RNase H-like nuclease (RuvC/YqgF family)